MVWLYVPELQLLSEELNPSFLIQEPFAMSKGKPIPLRSWPLRWKRDCFLKHLSGLMCEPSTANLGAERFLSSLEVSPVNLIQQQANNLPIKTQEICGRIFPASLARLDHTSSSWKTCQMSLSGHYPIYSKTFPKWGMMRRGVLWQLPKSEHHIKEKGGFFLPTPTASDGMRTNLTYGAGNLTLKGAVMFPTPNASEGDKITGLENQMSLTKMGREGTLGNGGKLNPEWVEWLMGWPIGFTGSEHVATE